MSLVEPSVLAILGEQARQQPDAPAYTEVLSRLDGIKWEVTSSISASYGLRVADLVLVSPGSLPITTSGKVRRSACAERCRQDEFTRLDTA